ncbi:methylamine dehydrogenase light chain [Cupriavidus basilensis]|uniref:Methylamine dehydrogenase light chain n=1 Tax=Cupriavidus basilensis TaxID=68895 RepID=A0A0C4YGN8_9BURK|nr:methylamine dehydrogenase light chain [Cupriavidus basilensis]AJG21870.1 Methylamine dehydrogenase light chain precursor [Cupriavidus basilensis]
MWMDRFFEHQTRRAAQRTGRRSVLATLGKVMVGTMALPVLPFDRSAHAAGARGSKAAGPQAQDETACDYWKYCAVDGFLCACCGGTSTSCPPGTEPSRVSWVGTCHNPADGRSYMVSYNDCCGKTTCGRCECNTNERERPGYRLGVHNDVNWCMSNDSTMFHCTTSIILGVQE